ncbi:uncharacterized protein VP01_1661g1 [Puccinia sorghi]|uniref:Uncharacterized protein n=1 Tax=Puccinia sorghi TaxID=27349 RepID=A0A0L6VG84_9BASI|nr:uncharacterized protein VP01_1661g1 [Puccinia sorghi]
MKSFECYINFDGGPLHPSVTTGFKKCVGFIDGTLFPQDKKPSIYSQDYYSRKEYYGIESLLWVTLIRGFSIT